MLEINEFNAIRISLASPEDILSWSFGEVTKPETINYRTLKPEPDGLFCQRIFGPVKDWECACGKYKRVRYKGVVCEKCGVEVTRSKVRRERMGHITLAAPVSHIWFVKGTPSRLGLLLDISPRNLERVIYFAAHVIVEIDEEKRAFLREQLQEDYEKRRAEIQQQVEERQLQLSSQLSQQDGVAGDAQTDALARIEQEYTMQRQSLQSEYEQLREQLEEMLGVKVEEDITFRGALVVEEESAISEQSLDQLDELVEKEFEKLSAIRDNDISDAELLVDADRERRESEVTEQQEQLQEKLQLELEKVIREEKEKLELVDSLRLHRVLSENENRILKELAPDVFRADMGASAVREAVSQVDLDELSNVLQEEVQTTTGQRRKKATKRLRVVENFRKSGNRPEWMILTVLPVIPPDLRPMVQLDGGRFATSDLNDLYRRVINRNNRLKRLIDHNAPEIIVRNEKRMLQEAVDALIDNGRRGRAVSGKGKHRLKSLSDMLKGKQGRFRQNLLGKRVDYSGRSVIVVGPKLHLHQCGLPKKMALELFKPFVMRRLVEKGFAHNIKSAKRIVERVRPEVWDVLEEVIQDYLVLLNRAPSLHRLSIQAFEAKLIEGSAIQLHPLVCAAFNADFDGDQMAVHVPLSLKAQEEARTRMLSMYNLLSPAHGEPIITPSQDIVLGCYYLTMDDRSAKGSGKKFASIDEAMLAYDNDMLDIRAPIWVRVTERDLAEPIDRDEENRLPYELRRLEGHGNGHSSEAAEVKTIGNTDMTSHYTPELDDDRTDIAPVVHQAPLPEEVVTMPIAERVIGDAATIKTQSPSADGTQVVLVETTIGRLIFNRALLPPLRYYNQLVPKKGLKEIIAACYKHYTEPNNIAQSDLELLRQLYPNKSEQELARIHGSEQTSRQADYIKELGFKYATLGGMTIGINDIEVPAAKEVIVTESEQAVAELDRQFRRGLITRDERYREVVGVWQRATKDVTEKVRDSLNPFSPVSMMATSGARGNINQISQMAGMRGLMSDPTGRIIELPIKANFREGLSVLEYFVSTHGGRKGLADTALRTADAGYLTRRLVDVAQDVIVTLTDCHTEEGVWLRMTDDDEVMETLDRRIVGRILAAQMTHPETGEVLAEPNQEIDEELAKRLVIDAGIDAVYVRSVLTCQSEHGICRMCYGRNLATGKTVDVGEAVGIVAAQSIGEPGTQLTLRTFHTGGVASADDITQGLPRVQEIFEARTPKGKALLADIDGIAEVIKDEDGVRKIRVVTNDVYTDEYDLPTDYTLTVDDGDHVSEGQLLAENNRADRNDPPIVAQLDGRVHIQGNKLVVSQEDHEEREMVVSHTARLRNPDLFDGPTPVVAGEQLTDGSADPQELLALQGREAVQRYLVNEAQKVYRSQGVNINDKHVEVIVRQMLRRVRIEEPGDTGMLPGELIEITEFKKLNEDIVSQGGEPAVAATMLLGITKASLNTDSFLSAASFQETTRVLTEASINGKVDYLRGLKENVVIGKLIPAGTGIEAKRKPRSPRHDDLVGEIARMLEEGDTERGQEQAEQTTESPEVEAARSLLGIMDGEDIGQAADELSKDEQIKRQIQMLLGEGETPAEEGEAGEAGETPATFGIAEAIAAEDGEAASSDVGESAELEGAEAGSDEVPNATSHNNDDSDVSPV